MGPAIQRVKPGILTRLLLALLAITVFSGTAQAWWNKEWTIRKKVTVDTSAEGGAITEPIGSAAVLIRLHDGNYQFLNAKEDGSDIRFVSEDDKTLLAHHVEKYDGLLNEAFVWVRVPDLKPGAKASFWLYYGNPAAPKAEDAKGTFEADTALVYHFAETGATAPVDSTGKGNNARNPGVPAQGSLIGGGLRLDGTTSVTIPASPSLEWKEGAPLTFSVWVKPAVFAPGAILFSRREGENAFVVGLQDGVPFVEITSAAGTQRSSAGEPLAVNSWRHLAVVADGAKTTLYVDGESYGTVAAGIPALKNDATLGKPEAAGTSGSTEQTGFSGEIDELEIANAARPVGALKLAAVSQSGSQKAAKLLQTAADEANSAGHSATLEHVMLFGDIARNMMFDGWIAVGVCVLMIVCGWGVAIRKFLYLNSIQKGSESFMEQWKHVSSDLTVLDHDDAQNVKTMGGKVDGKELELMHRSPLYHLYHIGSEEIRHRVGRGKDRSRGLSARSIQAIRASLESGLVRENQRMHKGLVLLTISIAGGPYVGLLGTVVGVMITFAIIAKSGEVDVNSIAPGIASALLATVAGLVVAIPALFIYSYLSSRIKDLLAGMQVFIDEFIAKMAEFYPTPADVPASAVRPSIDPAQLSRLSEAQQLATSSSSSNHAG